MRKDCTTFTQTQDKILAPLCQFVVQRVVLCNSHRKYSPYMCRLRCSQSFSQFFIVGLTKQTACSRRDVYSSEHRSWSLCGEVWSPKKQKCKRGDSLSFGWTLKCCSFFNGMCWSLSTRKTCNCRWSHSDSLHGLCLGRYLRLQKLSLREYNTDDIDLQRKKWNYIHDADTQ